MFPQLTHATARVAFLGLAAGALLFGSTSIVGEARPMLQTAPTLGTAASFVVLGGTTVTNTGKTTLNGDLGVSPGTAITGFPGSAGAVVNGTTHPNDAVAAQAQTDTTAAYTNLAGQSCPGTNDLTGKDLGALGRTLAPGVYCFSSSAQLTNALILDAQGDPNAVFVFKIGSTLTTASASSVVVINPGTASRCNVFWQVGSSATLGTTTQFLGTIIALTSITLTTGATISGRALARNGAVTLDTNTIGPGGCALTPAGATAAATVVAIAAATVGANATAATIATQAASASSTPTSPPSSSRPANTRTPTPSATSVPSTATAVTVATAAPTLPPAAPATATAPSVDTAGAGAAAAPVAAAPAAPVAAAPAPVSANSSVSAQAAGTPTPPVAAAAPPSIPVALVAPPAQVPSSLPRTGGGLPPLGLFWMVVGALALAAGLTVRRTRR